MAIYGIDSGYGDKLYPTDENVTDCVNCGNGPTAAENGGQPTGDCLKCYRFLVNVGIIK